MVLKDTVISVQICGIVMISKTLLKKLWPIMILIIMALSTQLTTLNLNIGKISLCIVIKTMMEVSVNMKFSIVSKLLKTSGEEKIVKNQSLFPNVQTLIHLVISIVMMLGLVLWLNKFLLKSWLKWIPMVITVSI